MAQQNSFENEKWYHCYNRGIDKRIAFADIKDYQRFLEILYLGNDTFPLRRNDLGARKFEEIMAFPRNTRIVDIAAFCLMPGHFHLVLRQRSEGGITTFMRKIGTAYTLYFNARYAREGNLFLKPFQSLQISSEEYPKLISYVHSAPTVLYEPEWKAGHVVDYQFLAEHLAAYPYSSLSAYYGLPGVVGALLEPTALSLARTLPVQKMLSEARQYASLHHIP